VNTGVPHAVIEVDDLEAAEVFRIGRIVRRHEAFAPAGTNVNFMKTLAPGQIAIRTYERGVEDETLACGTGMVACAIVHHEFERSTRPNCGSGRRKATPCGLSLSRAATVTRTLPFDRAGGFCFRGTLAID